MRTLAAGVLDALDKNEIFMTVLAEFDFIDGVERLWAGPEGHALDYDGEIWSSLADLGQIEKIAEAQDLTDARTVVSLRVNSETVADLGSSDSRGRSAKLLLVLLDQSGATIGDITFLKTMGKISISARASRDQEGTRVDELLTLELLDETANLPRKQFERMSYESALRIDAADHGLEYVSDPTVGDLPFVMPGRRITLPDGTEVIIPDLSELYSSIFS